MNVLKCLFLSILFININVYSFNNSILLKKIKFCRLMKVKVKKSQ